MKKNKERIKKFLAELENIPIVDRACNICGLSRNTIYRWRNEDKKFREKMDRAMDMGENRIDDLTHTKYYSLINKEHWQAVRHRLLNSPTRQQKSYLQELDTETEKMREILERWRDGNKERYQEGKNEEEKA